MANDTQYGIVFNINSAISSNFFTSFNAIRDRVMHLNQQINQLSSTSATANASQIAHLTRIRDLYSAQATNIDRFKGSVAQMLTGVASLKALSGALASPVKTAMEFEQSMKNVAAVANASSEDLAKLTAQARLLGAETSFSASQAAVRLCLFDSIGNGIKKDFFIAKKNLLVYLFVNGVFNG